MITFLDEAKLKSYLDRYDLQFVYQKTGLHSGAIPTGDLKLSDGFFDYCLSRIGKSTRYLQSDGLGDRRVQTGNGGLVVPTNLFHMYEQGGDEFGLGTAETSSPDALKIPGLCVTPWKRFIDSLDILEYFNRNPLLRESVALKGGHSDQPHNIHLPRLSVDIDLDYLKPVGRNAMLAQRQHITARYSEVYGAQNYRPKPQGQEDA